MEYIIIGVLIVIAAICAMLFLKKKAVSESNVTVNMTDTTVSKLNESKEDSSNEIVIEMEMLPSNMVLDDSKLVEIKDEKVLGRINNLVSGFAQVTSGAYTYNQELYRAILPAGEKLANSKTMEGAYRGIFHGADGIKGHADLVASNAHKGTAVMSAAVGVASMVVGQYYMTQINSELGMISDSISKISDFQDNEYRSRVFSLIAHVKRISNFQAEILENSELRLSKIAQIDGLEEECTQLLGQANLTIAGYAKKKDISYDEYESNLSEIHKWRQYQKSLLDVLYKISELRYTLHLGAVSREQCVALLPTYTNQVVDTQEGLANWHQDTVERLHIDMKESRRKKEGFDEVLSFIPGLINNDLNYNEISQSIISMIDEQIKVNRNSYQQEKSELYLDDVQLIAKDGKIYYLPEG